MKAIGIILAIIMWIIFVLLPTFCTSYIGGGDKIQLIENNPWLFAGILFTAISSGLFISMLCIKFYEWFKSNIKQP